MKAAIGQFYKHIKDANHRANELKRMWQGRNAFVVVGNNNGYLVISESSARACGLVVSYKERRYNKLPSKLNK